MSGEEVDEAGYGQHLVKNPGGSDSCHVLRDWAVTPTFTLRRPL